MKRDRCARAAAGLLGLALAAEAARADTVTLAPVRDNTLIQSLTGSLSSGSGVNLFAGRTAQPTNSIRRGVIAFDVAGSIPPGSSISGVTLTLHLSQTSAGPRNVSLNRLLADWGEGASNAGGGGGAPSAPGDATWIHTFFDVSFWTSAGGDFAAVPSAIAAVDQVGFYAWGSNAELVADVQAWLDAPSSNHGWILLGDEGSPSTSKRFDSREIPDPAFRPSLLVEFAPPCVPEPAPAGQGYWHRQCLGVPESAGGLDPGRGGRGPSLPTEPGFVDELMPCADDLLAQLGLDPTTTCQGIDAAPPSDPCERARRSLTALALDLCSDRIQTSCPVDAGAPGCLSDSVGELLEEVAGLVLAGDCRQAVECAGGTE